MVAMAERRRARGLPASVINIGMVVGIGVVERSQNDKGVSTMENSIRQMHYMPVSETDLHHIFAEAILVGRRDESPELITGLETYKPVTGETPFWHRNVRFSHLITDPDAVKPGAKSSGSAQKSLKEMLITSGGPDEAMAVMENALLEYLASSLKVRTSQKSAAKWIALTLSSCHARPYTQICRSLIWASIPSLRFKFGIGPGLSQDTICLY